MRSGASPSAAASRSTVGARISICAVVQDFLGEFARVVELPGKNASAANRTALALPPITTAWQDRALWRQAFRHVGIANSALPAVWKALARELPSLFRRGGSGNQSS